jgi:hypothetical protein
LKLQQRKNNAAYGLRCLDLQLLGFLLWRLWKCNAQDTILVAAARWFFRNIQGETNGASIIAIENLVSDKAADIGKVSIEPN